MTSFAPRYVRELTASATNIDFTVGKYPVQITAIGLVDEEAIPLQHDIASGYETMQDELLVDYQLSVTQKRLGINYPGKYRLAKGVTDGAVTLIIEGNVRFHL